MTTMLYDSLQGIALDWYGCGNIFYLESPNVILLNGEGGKSWVGDESLMVNSQNVPVAHSNPRKCPEM